MARYTITQGKVTTILEPVAERRIVRLYTKDGIVIKQENVVSLTVKDIDGQFTEVELITDKADAG